MPCRESLVETGVPVRREWRCTPHMDIFLHWICRSVPGLPEPGMGKRREGAGQRQRWAAFCPPCLPSRDAAVPTDRGDSSKGSWVYTGLTAPQCTSACWGRRPQRHEASQSWASHFGNNRRLGALRGAPACHPEGGEAGRPRKGKRTERQPGSEALWPTLLSAPRPLASSPEQLKESGVPWPVCTARSTEKRRDPGTSPLREPRVEPRLDRSR